MNNGIKGSLRRAQQEDEEMGQPAALPTPEAERKTTTIMCYIDAELKEETLKAAKEKWGLNQTQVIERGLAHVLNEAKPSRIKKFLRLLK
jgi:hypothetical protein